MVSANTIRYALENPEITLGVICGVLLVLFFSVLFVACTNCVKSRETHTDPETGSPPRETREAWSETA